jgi:transposase-like protein
MEVTSRMASSFGEEHFGQAQLGDKRLTKRLVSVVDQLVRHPEGSFPDKFKSPAELAGFYNLVANPKITHAKVLAAHYARTLEVMRQQQGVVLILHDTTVLDYSGLDIAELEQVGNGNGRGYYCHNSLAVTPQRQVLGLAQQMLHTRRRVPKGETRSARRQRSDRESLWWKKSSATIPTAPPGKLWVDIADRGGPGRGGGYSPPLPQIRTCAINASGSSGRRFACKTAHRMDCSRRWQRVALQQPTKAFPRKEAAPFPTRQPFLPQARHRYPESRQRKAVAGDAVVVAVATHLLTQ